MLFRKKDDTKIVGADSNSDFAYLPDSAVYLDSACQSLRPQPVIDAVNEYYQKFNSCGERVKYQWGLTVDERVAQTRLDILKFLKLSPRKYFVSFTLNTTYGLNLILSQLKPDGLDKVITSEIEHNSVFLSTMAFSRRTGLPRAVISRNDDGSVNLDDLGSSSAVVVLNAVSNIDGRQLKNLTDVASHVHKHGGILIVDAAQAMSHYHQLLAGVNADAICFSSHKMYGPSLGVIVAKKSLIERLQPSFLGGGMVDDVDKDDFILSSTSDEHIHTIFEPGLQSYGEIIGLSAAVKWLDRAGRDDHVLDYAGQLLDFLKSARGFHVLNNEITPTIAFYHDKRDIYGAHLLAKAMSDQGIMARSGHFCAHYYLAHVKKYPPLVRLSLGLHNRQSDVDKFIDVMKGIAK